MLVILVTQQSAYLILVGIDYGTPYRIAGHSSLFSSPSMRKSSHFITLVDGSKIANKGIAQIFLVASLIPECPFNLISLSQVTHTLIL